MFDFEIDVAPMSLNNAYNSNREGRRFLTAKGRFYKNSIAWAAKSAMSGRPVFQDPIEIHFQFFYPDNRKRDLDNSIKLTLDSLVGICFEDDSEIVKIIAEKKIDKINPHICISIQQLKYPNPNILK